ncbi:DUF2750 domain-containing protein [Arthrobacter sp. KNU-44]|uniref:DUF2750 domain-containing protein n=1 Tax=unclassified Arthrobacter TaxID=235627 RepID=UPI003F43EBC3
MSVHAAQAALFYEEIVKNGEVLGIRDAVGIPAPVSGDGERSMPFWSLRSRAEQVIANIPAYGGFEPMAIPFDVWRTRWIDGLEGDGILVGLNWTGARASGHEFGAAEVRIRLGAIEDKA